MSALFTALVESETKESLAIMVCELRDKVRELEAVTLTPDQCRAIVKAFDEVDCSETGYQPFEELRTALAPILTGIVWRTAPSGVTVDDPDWYVITDDGNAALEEYQRAHDVKPAASPDQSDSHGEHRLPTRDR